MADSSATNAIPNKMLSLPEIRADPDIVRADLKKRGMGDRLSWVDEVIEKDARWRSLKRETDDLRHKRNAATEAIKLAKTDGGDMTSLIEAAKSIPKKIKAAEEEMTGLRERIDHILMRLPNILHESVPSGASDAENLVVKEAQGASPPGFELVHHGQLAQDLGVADFERAVKISGAGFYFLKGGLAIMDMALQQLAVKMLYERGYTIVEPPFMMRRKPYEGVTDLADFEDVMYGIEGEDEYMIATSEHPIAAMYQDEILEPADLPIKYAGISSCFRKEIGKHGLDERGLFRVHQFQKIEQFIFCDPADSWELHEKLLANAEDFMTALGIPYQVVNVCTGDMGTVASKKYDIEGYSPREDKFIELVSCSNCTAYQATRLNIRMRGKEGTKPLHTLNSTMVATSRTLRLILENYQREDGSVEVPKALLPYMNGIEELRSK